VGTGLFIPKYQNSKKSDADIGVNKTFALKLSMSKTQQRNTKVMFRADAKTVDNVLCTPFRMCWSKL